MKHVDLLSGTQTASQTALNNILSPQSRGETSKNETEKLELSNFSVSSSRVGFFEVSDEVSDVVELSELEDRVDNLLETGGDLAEKNKVEEALAYYVKAQDLLKSSPLKSMYLQNLEEILAESIKDLNAFASLIRNAGFKK